MPNPLRILCVIANPSDLPRFDDAQVWAKTAEPFLANPQVLIERLAEPTESGLKRALAEGRWDALHFVVHAEERIIANRGTIALVGAGGLARKLTAPYLAGLVAASPSVRLVVLQALGMLNVQLKVVAQALVAQGVAVVTGSSANSAYWVPKLYFAVIAGLTPEEIVRELGWSDTEVSSSKREQPIFGVRDIVMQPPPDLKPPPPPPPRSRSGEFDVFLCHNWDDKPAVKRIAQRLKEAGIHPWLDEEQLPPGQPWQRLLEQQIGRIKSAAVFVGAAGMGPWQEEEIDALLRVFKKRKAPVIPVLLPDAPSQPDLPLFLGARTWVDFRRPDPDPLKQLLWGITGQRPDD